MQKTSYSEACSTGTVSKSSGGTVVVASRLFFDGTVVGSASANDLSRLTDAREKGRIGIFGSALSYAGSYGRVTSESLGRDLNPLGRGDGGSYVAGGLNLGRISPALPGNMSPGGWGNSVNNGCGESNAPITKEEVSSGYQGGTKCESKPAGCCSKDSIEYTIPEGAMACCNPCYGMVGVLGPDSCDCRTLLWYDECQVTPWCLGGPQPELPKPDDNCPDWAKNKCWREAEERSIECAKKQDADLRRAALDWGICKSLVALTVAKYGATYTACLMACNKIPPGILYVCCVAGCRGAWLFMMCLGDNDMTKCAYSYDLDVWVADTNHEACMYDSCVSLRRCLKRAGCPSDMNCSFNPPPRPQEPTYKKCDLNESLLSVLGDVALICGLLGGKRK